jgi:hypothetical protein
MRALKVLLCSIAMLTALVFAPRVQAQVSIGIGIGTPPPTCPWGYYNYAPYACAPQGFWGPNYFYNGIFLGVGPWYHWGYRNGWGNHRFDPGRGGYVGRGGPGYYDRGYANRGRPGARPGIRPGGGGGGFHGGGRPGGGHSGGGHPGGGRGGGRPR